MPIFPIFLAYFFAMTSGKNLLKEIKGWSPHHGYTKDAWYSPQHRGGDGSASKKVRKAIRTQESMSGSISRAYYLHKLFGVIHSSTDPKRPLQFPKVRVFSILVLLGWKKSLNCFMRGKVVFIVSLSCEF